MGLHVQSGVILFHLCSFQQWTSFQSKRRKDFVRNTFIILYEDVEYGSSYKCTTLILRLNMTEKSLDTNNLTFLVCIKDQVKKNVLLACLYECKKNVE